MRSSPVLVWSLFCLFLLSIPATALADFTFVSQSAVFSPSTQEVTFTVEFNQAPDFTTTNALGQQADSFQYNIFGDPSAPYPGIYDSIVRGEELHLSGSQLRVRNSVPPDPDPASGGWGSVRGAVPFTVNGDVLSFSAPLSLLSDHSADGNLTYLFTTLDSGTGTGFVRGQTTTSVTPEPSTMVLLATGILAWSTTARRRRSWKVRSMPAGLSHRAPLG